MLNKPPDEAGQNKKKVIIISHFSDGAEQGGNDRFNYLAHLLSNDFNVELLTSSFYHTKKQQHGPVKPGPAPYQIIYAFEPGYSNNISLKRFYSHRVFGRNVREYLNCSKIADLIYCAVPSIDVGKAACDFAKRNNVPFILDVQDLWPEAFKMVFDVPVLRDIVFIPMLSKINNIYKSADEIIAVSDTYCERALENNKKGAIGYSVFLGTDMNSFDHLAEVEPLLKKSEDEFRIAYAGTLGHSYNIKVLLDAVDILQKRGYNQFRLIVMGDGPLQKEFEDYAISNKINADFMGRLPYSEMVKNLVACNIAVNPIQKRSAASIINKHGDYAMAGLPVISTQESPEYRNLLNMYEAGFTCDNKDATKMADLIEELYHNKELRSRMAANSRRMGQEKFDRNKTYQVIVDIIKSILLN